MAAASLAEQFRAARLAFELALELGCTPREAARVLRRRARGRIDACGRRAPEPMHADSDDLQPVDPAPADFSSWGATWMMRD